MFYFFVKNWRAILAVLISIASLTLISAFPKVWIFFLVNCLWLGLLVVLSIFPLSKNKTNPLLPLVIVTALSFIVLTSIVEWSVLALALRLLAGLVMWFLFLEQRQNQRITLAHARKPLRRINMILWVFAGYTFLTTIFAFRLFFPSVPFWFFLVLAGAGMSAISFMIWRLYYDLKLKQSVIWLLFIGMVIIELVWVMNVLPFGYFVSGFLVTWIWYVLQLLLRFHFSPRGIDWKKQASFLIINGCLFFVCMFFIRWI